MSRRVSMSKPKFDPSKPFETAKPKFDPNASFQVPEPVSQIESGIRGAAQGASLGFADELTAALESGAGSLGLVPDKTYEQSLAESRANYKAAEQANPMTSLAGNLVGGLGSAVLAPVSAATIPGRIAQAAGMGAVAGYGMNEDRDKLLADMARGGAVGGLVGSAAEGATSGAKKLADYLGTKAESLMTKATGATGKQAAEFKPGTGRMLLESPEISAFDTPAGIAEKTQEMMGRAGNKMSDVLQQLDTTGQKVSQENIISQLESRIADMASDPSTAQVRNKLQGVVDDIKATGAGEISPIKAEEIKRGFNKMAGNWMNPEVGQAGKEAYGAYKSAVESAVEMPGANPLQHRQVSPEKFHDIVENVRNSGNMYKANITPYSVEDYAGFKTFLSPDNKSGYAIKPDGELISVFSKVKGRGERLLDDAVLNKGASKLDAYDIGGKLPKLYGKYMDETSRYKFDPQYLTDELRPVFESGELGQPDVVMMGLNPNKVQSVYNHPLADQFKAAKSEYGMLAPVQEAAARRAGTLNQSPAGGLLDAARAAAGGTVGGVPGMVASSVGGKILAPRIANISAHSADFISKLIKTPPAMLGKFAPVIQNAAVRGQSAVAVTDWLLEQNNPEYRDMKSRLNGN